MHVIEIIERAAAERVLIVGALPPVGHDYDLLAREDDLVEIAAALQSSGFTRGDREWTRHAAGGLEVVELLTPAEWRLRAAEADALFADAQPLPDHTRVCEPAPAHQLLILARKLPRTPGLLAAKHRRRVLEALECEPRAWALAAERAPAWGVGGRLRRLRARAARPAWVSAIAGRLRRPRRGAIVALSGLDGVGKSTQAEALRASLRALGFDAAVVWTPIGNSPTMERFASLIKRALASLPFGPLAHADRGDLPRRVLSASDGGGAPGTGRRLTVFAWSTATALANAISYRRAARGARRAGKIVIYDRYVLDSIVQLRFAYAPDGQLAVQEALIRRIAPRPRCAFLLDAPAEAAHARKPDWSLEQMRAQSRIYDREHERLGVRRIDAAGSADQVADQITREVLAAISR